VLLQARQAASSDQRVLPPLPVEPLGFQQHLGQLLGQPRLPVKQLAATPQSQPGYCLGSVTEPHDQGHGQRKAVGGQSSNQLFHLFPLPHPLDLPNT